MNKITKKLMAAALAATMVISSIPVSAENVSYQYDGLEACEHLDQYVVDDYEWLTSSNASDYSIYAVTLPEYTEGDFFTDNSLECTDHGTVGGVYVGNPCTVSVDCNCKEFESSIQCAGFARYIYHTYHGYSINAVSKNTLNSNISSSATAQNYIADLPDGTFIKVKARTGSGSLVDHFMIVSTANEDNVLLYHANYGGNCKVRNMRIDYATFAYNFPYIYYTC